MKKWNFTIGISLLFVLIFTSVLLDAEDKRGEAEERLLEVYRYISQYHVSGMSEEELVDAAIDGMIESLDDPFTEYMSADEFDLLTDAINQNYVGIGVRIADEPDGFYVTEVFADSPAAEAGLKPGDRFVKVDGQTIGDQTIDELVPQIQGPEGSTVTITIERNGELMPLTLERRALQIPSVEMKWLAEGTGYLRYTTFSDQAVTDFAKGLQELKENGLERLIVDLRGNTGGYLHVASEMITYFMEEGNLLYMQDSSGRIQPYPFARGKNLDIPVVLLVDSMSASASELFAGALQDYGIATLVGQQTYGKGSVQQLIPLSDGSYLRLTVQRYLTPGKHHVDGIGIAPDVEVFGQTAQLLAAMHQIGAKTFDVVVREYDWSINGANFQSAFPYIVENEEVFVPSRILAALTGASIEWNGGQKQVEFHFASGQKSAFAVSDQQNVILEEGITFINLNQFAQVFSGITIQFDGDVLSFKVGE